MIAQKTKYLISALLAVLFLLPVIGFALPAGEAALRLLDQTPDTAAMLRVTLPTADAPRTEESSAETSRRARRTETRRHPAADTTAPALIRPVDTLPGMQPQALSVPASDTVRRRSGGGGGLDEIISGKSADSLYYDVRNRTAYLYNQGEVKYQNMALQGDFMRMELDSKTIYAHGKRDTVEGKPSVTNPVFQDGGTTYTMDTITYNIGTKKAKIKGVATQEGDGWLIGHEVKKMPDNSINIRGGQYTTCDHTDHPHFYLQMTQAKVIPGKKVVTGPAYLVLEDVPIYFPLLPEGFFPLNSGPKSGLLMPTFGEDGARGFFLRDLGYYFTLSKHMDLAIRGGFYTLGSWEVSAQSNYVKRYKFRGNFNIDYSNIRTGDKGSSDYIKQNALAVNWTHTQDPKANPGSTFSASVKFQTSGYNQYAATTLNDMLATQTNSSISYSKNWAGTPFSLTASMNVSQNSQNKTISATLPNIVFNVATFYPFKRKEMVGKARWYEKISMRYSATFTNNVSADESDIFSKKTLENMRNGIQHKLPISASYNIFNYINFGPSFNYDERWYFKKVEQVWNPVTNQIDKLAPEYGFYRIYNYNLAVQASTTIYGSYSTKKKERKVQAIRHTLAPNISFSYAPDFSKQKYGFYQTVQSDSTGRTKTYSPFADNAFGVPGSGQNMSINFSLSQTLEMKVLSDRDTSGIRKIKLIDEFRFNGSYNFLADSLGLSNIPMTLRTTLFNNFGVTINATLDPYEISPEGVRYNKLMIRRGLIGRIASASTTLGYSFQSRQDRSQPAANDISTVPIDPLYTNPFYDPYGQMDPVLRREHMAKAYYDFSLPWNFSFNYSIRYTASPTNNGTTGYKKVLDQNISFNASVNITPKTGVTIQSGYNFTTRKIETTSISITRDLHCWQMSFMWIPFGPRKSWSFNIGVVASSLADLKYDKSQSQFDNLY